MSEHVDEAAAEQSAIYDIGYRHYRGPRLGQWYGVRTLLVNSLLGAYGIRRSAKSKVMPMLMFGCATLPALVVGIVVNVTHASSLPLAYTAYTPALWLVISIFVAGQAPQTVSKDLRFRSVVLYFSRPLERGRYVLAKVGAMTAALFALIAIPLTVMYVSALLAQLPAWKQTRDYLAGLAGAVLFALVLALIGLVVAAFTPRRGLGVAAVVSVLVLAGGVGLIVQGVSKESGHQTLAGYAGMINPFSLVDGVQVWLLHAESSAVVGPPGGAGGAVFAAVTAALVAACYGLLSWRYRKVSLS